MPKKLVGIFFREIAFVIMTASSGNMTNWIRMLLFLNVSLNCFFKMINIGFIADSFR